MWRDRLQRAAIILSAAILYGAFVSFVMAKVNAKLEPAEQPPSVTESPVSGRELWESLPPELLSNVAEGIEEHISDLMDDLKEVQDIQRRKLNEEPGRP